MNSELSMDQALIGKLTKILEVNLDREHFGVKELAKEAGLSRSQLHRKLISITGKSTCRFIRDYRLDKAMEMLQNEVATASEVAYRVGFSSPTYFNTCFHDFYGYPPGEAKLRNPKVLQDVKESEKLELVDDAKAISETPSVKKHPLRHKLVWVNTFFIVLLSVIIYYLYQNYNDTSNKEILNINNNNKSIGVLPFKNLSTDMGNQYFADGMMENTLNHLSSLEGLEVKSRQSVEKYRDSDKTMVEIGKELGVNYLLEGSLQKEKDSVRIIIQLIDAKNDNHIWADKYDFELKQVFKVQSEISRKIASELKTAISPEGIEQINKKPTKSIEAYNLYLKGRYFWHMRTEEGLQKSIKYFSEALELDPDYALVYAGLADSYQIMANYRLMPRDEGFNKARELAQKALLIDPNNAEAHAILGTLLHYQDWNWEAAEKELKLAIVCNPNYATAHQYYSELLRYLGRSKEARKEIDIAQSLNPNSTVMQRWSSQLYLDEGLFEKAIIEANKAKEINKNLLPTYWIIINCYSYLGKNEEAMAEWEEMVKLIPNPNLEFNEGLRNAFKTGGIMGFWRFYNDSFLNSDHPEKSAYSIASILAYLGETEKALDWLELAYERRSSRIIGIKSNYDFKVLRNEPRFLALLKKMNLGDYEE